MKYIFKRDEINLKSTKLNVLINQKIEVSKEKSADS